MIKEDRLYWQELLERYRLSKRIRRLRRNYSLLDLCDLMKETKQYIYAIQEMTIKPSQDFINKLKDIENEI